MFNILNCTTAPHIFQIEKKMRYVEAIKMKNRKNLR